MNNKDTLYFIANCLSISTDKKNSFVVEKILRNDKIDWENIVKISTAHYIFPALYFNFKRSKFLKFLPKDLVTYMQNIAEINKNRNTQILKQANEINNLLLSDNINPVFLKGTGNLLLNLYQDIGERMVGDIDFIVPKNQYKKSIYILRKNGYYDVKDSNSHFPSYIHYQRLKKDKSIAAVEIHKEIVSKKYSDEFNYNFIIKDSQNISGILHPSYANKLNLSIISNQINDDAFYYKTILLKNAYDVLLLSKLSNAKGSAYSLNKLKTPINCFLAICNKIFNGSHSLDYHKTKYTENHVKIFDRQLDDIIKTKRKHIFINFCLSLKSRLNFLYNSIFHKKYRIWLYHKLIESLR